MRKFLALVVKTLSTWVRPHRANPQAWMDGDPEDLGRYVWHAVVVRAKGHVWGRGWFATREAAQLALAELVAECNVADWSRRFSSVTAARVIRSWRSASDNDVYGGDWHTRVLDLNDQYRTNTQVRGSVLDRVEDKL